MGNLCKSSRYLINHCIRKLGVFIKFISILKKNKHFILRKSLFLPDRVKGARLICGMKLKNLENILNILFLELSFWKYAMAWSKTKMSTKKLQLISFYFLFMVFSKSSPRIFVIISSSNIQSEKRGEYETIWSLTDNLNFYPP